MKNQTENDHDLINLSIEMEGEKMFLITEKRNVAEMVSDQIEGKSGNYNVAHTHTNTQKANAERMCIAVNNFDEMRSWIEKIVRNGFASYELTYEQVIEGNRILNKVYPATSNA